MRTTALAATIALLGLSAGCGGDDGSAAAPPAPAEQEASAPAAVEGEGAGEPQVLLGTVGEPDNPDAFTITLTDAAGEPVDSVPAGSYEIRVVDLSQIHNFHLIGPDVDESTTVPETTQTVWEVELEAGDYTYVCDPHASMIGELTVT